MTTKKPTKKALESKVKALEAQIEQLQQENSRLKIKIEWYENLPNVVGNGISWLTGQIMQGQGQKQ